jgi:hypothetical protein
MPPGPGVKGDGNNGNKTGPLLTLDRPEKFQGKMAVFTPKLEVFLKIGQTISRI